MMRIGKRGLFLILIVLVLLIFGAYKLQRAYWRRVLKCQIEPEKTTPTSSFSDIKRYYTVKAKLEPLSKRVRRLVAKEKVAAGAHRISDIYSMEKISRPLHLKSFEQGDWRLKAIDDELAFFKSKGLLKKEAITAFIQEIAKSPFWKEHYLLGHFKIEEGVLKVKDFTRQHYRFKEIAFALMRLTENTKLPDMEFLVSVHDSLEHADLKLAKSRVASIGVPIFVASKKKQTKHLLLFPDHEMLAGYDQLEKILSSEADIPWSEKEPRAFWRGATTSGDFAGSGWELFPRSRLIRESVKDKASLIDAKFSYVTEPARENKSFMHFCARHPATTSSLASIEDHLVYKYLIDIDGNASTYSRYYWILRSKCLPIKVVSNFKQWYYPGLTAGRHFMPVKEDLSDLKEQLAWAKQHDKEAEQIATSSACFAQEALSEDEVYSYLYHLLVAYSELFEP